MKRAALSLLFLLLISRMYAGSGYILLKDTVKLFYVTNNEVYSPDGRQLLYYQKGNIFFAGGNDDRTNIFLMTSSMNPASNKLELIYEKSNRQPSYSFTNNKFYAGKTESDDIRTNNELLHIERSKKWLAFYSTYNDSLVAYYAADSFPGSIAIIVAYTLIKQLDLEKKTAVVKSKPSFKDNAFATIKPAWGNTTDNEWIWDGKVLRPRWNVDTRLIWTYDEQIIKPMYSTDIHQQYSWDGEILKPLWHTNRALEWSWDGRLIKPVWDTDWANQYKIEEGL